MSVLPQTVSVYTKEKNLNKLCIKLTKCSTSKYIVTIRSHRIIRNKALINTQI